MTRDYFLDEAKKCICGRRDLDYGTPEDSFELISILWSTYTKTKISAKDVAIMMALLKIARAKNSDNADSFIDLCGYGAFAGEIATKNKQDKRKPNCELY